MLIVLSVILKIFVKIEEVNYDLIWRRKNMITFGEGGAKQT
jgi:hypothetical protein